VNEVLEAIGVRNSRRAAREANLWTLHPWRHPIPTWRGVWGKDTDTLANAVVLKKVLLDAIAAPGHPGAGRVHQAEQISRGEFFGRSDTPEIPSRSLSTTDLDGLELDISALQAHLRGLVGLSGNVATPSDDGLLDLGVLELGDLQIHLTYALRQPPPNAAAIVAARANGARVALLLPVAANEVPGISSVILQNPLPAKNALIRSIAAKLALTEQLPAILTAPDAARLVVDTCRGTIWFDRIVIPDLKKNEHPFRFVELLARNAPNAVSKADLNEYLSPGRKEDDGAARAAKSKAKRTVEAAVRANGVQFDDPFHPESGGYRLTVPAYVV
jgi:hypothetical protein